jgi:hypothetical protein
VTTNQPEKKEEKAPTFKVGEREVTQSFILKIKIPVRTASAPPELKEQKKSTLSAFSTNFQPFVPKSFTPSTNFTPFVPSNFQPTSQVPINVVNTTNVVVAPPKPTKKLISIIDPVTGKDIFGNVAVPPKEEEKKEEKKEEKIEKEPEPEPEDSLDVEVEDSLDVEIEQDGESDEEDSEDEDEDSNEEDSEDEEDSDSSGEESDSAQKKRVYSKEQLLKFKFMASEPPDVLKRSDIFVDGNRSTPTSDFKPSWQGKPGTKPGFPSKGKRVQGTTGGAAGKKLPKGKKDKGPKLEKSKALRNQIEKDKTISEIKYILNKLSEENYAAIKKELLEVDVKDEEVIAVINQIFETAINNSVFASMYADLCNDLSSTEDTIYGKETQFRKHLLNSCQSEFMKIPEARKTLKLAKANHTLSEVEILEISTKLKQRILGNMSFIGELFKRGMLSGNIMLQIINDLLLNEEKPEEDSIEILCSLLTNIGKTLESQEKYKDFVEEFYEKLLEIKAEKETSARIKFMILDLMDLKKNNYEKPQEKKKKTAPAPINTKKNDSYQNNSGNNNFVQNNTSGQKKKPSQDFRKQKTVNVDKNAGSSSKKPNSAGRGYSPVQSSPEWEVQGNAKKSTNFKGKKNQNYPNKNRSTSDFEIDSTNSFSALDEEESPTTSTPTSVVTPTSPITIKKRPSETSNEDIENKTASMLNALVDGGDFEDAMDELKEMKINDYSISISKMVDIVIEKKDSDRKLAVDLIRRCVGNDIYNEKQLINGLSISISKAIDSEIYFDVPKYFDWVGEIIGRLLYEKVISFENIDKLVKLEPLSASQLVQLYVSLLKTMKSEYEIMNENPLKAAKSLSTISFNFLNLIKGKKIFYDNLIKGITKDVRISYN